MVFFKCFKSNTITILVKEGDSQVRGTMLKLCAQLTNPKALVLPMKYNLMHIKSWSSEVFWEVTDVGRLNTKKNACTSRILILNPLHHVLDNSPASFELLGDHILSRVVTWNSTLSTTGEAIFVEFYWEWLEDVLSLSKDVLTNDAMKYKKLSKKSGRKKTTKPEGDSDPSGAIGLAKCCAPAELKVFKNLGVALEHMEESYLAVFLAYWLCKFVFPKADVNFIRPRIFKMASKMTTGESFSHAIPVLANTYDGLSVVSNSASTEDRVAFRQVGAFFIIFNQAGAFDDKAQALFRSCDGLRMDHLARGGSARRGLIDDSHLCFSDLSYFTSLRSRSKGLK
uniref:Uncharacterized protein n=1 Tax=Malus domestica TaxID=3750 RepID=E4Z8P1_MALDO|nr:hypothetical protein [Malus domestica]